jgi:hypothetical protein
MNTIEGTIEISEMVYMAARYLIPGAGKESKNNGYQGVHF